jgi:hypothetical protein
MAYKYSVHLSANLLCGHRSYPVYTGLLRSPMQTAIILVDAAWCGRANKKAFYCFLAEYSHVVVAINKWISGNSQDV